MNCLKLKAFSFALLAAGLPVCAEAMQWPDTAQELCYDNTKEIPCPTDENSPFYGQDAQYQGTARSYTKLGQGGVALPDDATEWIMVRDNVTGLTWEMKNNDDGVENYSNHHDVDNIYGYVYYGQCGSDNDTEKFIASINNEKFGGYSDWRLPDIKELSSIFFTGLLPYVDWNFLKPSGRKYWSLSESPTSSAVWYLNFFYENYYFYENGVQQGRPCIDRLHIRAVRGGK